VRGVRPHPTHTIFWVLSTAKANAFHPAQQKKKKEVQFNHQPIDFFHPLQL
jgi:hypothetical protein